MRRERGGLPGSRECVGLGIIPGEPLGWVCFDRGGMALKGAEVIEGVGPVESASMDEAHEEITHARSVFGFVTEGVFSMENRHLERSFADVVGKGRTGHAQQ